MGIKLSEVAFTYRYSKKHENKFALLNANLEINNNEEFITIVGHTGSGKSTLVQILNSLLVPSLGHVSVEFNEENKYVRYDILGNGKKTKYCLREDLSKKLKYKSKVLLKPLRRHIGLVFQFPEYQLFEETVLKDIMFGPKNFLKDEKKAEDEAKKIADLMGISDLLDKSPFSLSGGQMRKVAIAGILASKPDILVLDEPTVGLDPLAKKELLEFLKYLNEVEKKSIIIITHDMDVVGEYAKRVIVLNKSEIKYDGSKDELFRNEQIIESNNLNYPNIVNIMRNLKDKLHIDLDIYKYNIEDAFKEILRAKGEENER